MVLTAPNFLPVIKIPTLGREDPLEKGMAMLTTVTLVNNQRKMKVYRTMIHLSESWKRILEGHLLFKG